MFIENYDSAIDLDLWTLQEIKLQAHLKCMDTEEIKYIIAWW